MAVEKRTDPLVQVERSETVIQDLRMAPGAPIEAGWPDSGKNNQQLSVKSSINDGLKRGPVGGDMSFLLVTNCTPWKLSWPACQYRLWPECYACLEVIPSMPRTDTLQAGLKFSGSLGQLRFYAILLPSALDSESPHHSQMPEPFRCRCVTFMDFISFDQFFCFTLLKSVSVRSKLCCAMAWFMCIAMLWTSKGYLFTPLQVSCRARLYEVFQDTWNGLYYFHLFPQYFDCIS